jgi:flagellar protein FliJ
MKPFRLQSVLDYRKRLENMAQKSLLICLEEQSLLNTEKQNEKKEVLRLCEELQKAKQKTILLPEVMLYEECIQVRKKHVNDISRELEALDSEIKHKKEELIKARQEKKALEILKEKREKKKKENKGTVKIFFWMRLQSSVLEKENEIG